MTTGQRRKYTVQNLILPHFKTKNKNTARVKNRIHNDVMSDERTPPYYNAVTLLLL